MTTANIDYLKKIKNQINKDAEDFVNIFPISEEVVRLEVSVFNFV